MFSIFAAILIFSQGDPREVACRKNLLEIGRALAAYERDNGALPDHLSLLIPRYLPDASVLHCPADSTEGDVGPNPHMKDPRVASSYEYDFSAVLSNGLGDPLGPFPKADVGNSWGTWRHVNTHQRTFFGDWVPIVRCYHHRPSPDSTAPDRILNLTSHGIYVTDGEKWQNDWRVILEALSRFQRDIKALGIEKVKRVWHLGRMEQYSYGWDVAVVHPEIREKQKRVASMLAGYAEHATEDRPFLYRIAGRWYEQAGDLDSALKYIRRSLELTADAHDRQVTHYVLAAIYEARHQDDLLVPLYKGMLELDRQNRFLLDSLANVYARKGRRQAAEALRDAADPGRNLLGQRAPVFEVPLFGGGTASLPGLLKGKKALLINFWYLH